MATTNKGIYYPDDYSQVADVPADLKKLAESVDKAIDDIPQYDDSDTKKDIQTIQQEQQIQNTSIQNNTEELELLKNNLPDPVTTEELEEITVQDAMNYYGSLDVSGNSTQEQTEQGANLWWDNDTMNFSNENRQNLTTQTIKAGTYKFSCDVSNLVLGTNASLTLHGENTYSDETSELSFGYIDNITANGRYSKEVVIPKDITTLKLKIGATLATNGGSMTISNLCLRTDDSDVYVEYVPDSPSSDYPSKIKNCGDNINELKLDDVEETTNAHGITYSVKDGVVTLNGASIRAHYIAFNASKFDLPAGDYTMSGKELAGSCSGISGKQLNNDDNSKNLFNGGTITSTVTNTIGNDETGVHLALYIGSTAVFNNYKIKIKLEKGSIATPYSPYNCGSVDIKVENEDEEQTITFPLSEGQKLRLGDYLDDDGVHHVRKQRIINLNDYVATMPQEGLFFLQNKSTGITWDYTSINALCSHFKNAEDETITTNNQANANLQDNEFNFRAGDTKDRIYFKNSAFTTLEDWQNFFNENEVLVEYECAEYTEAYTEEQQTVRNELKNLILYKGYNYITCTDETKCKMQLTYRPDNNIKIKSLEERVAALENSEVTA